MKRFQVYFKASNNNNNNNNNNNDNNNKLTECNNIVIKYLITLTSCTVGIWTEFKPTLLCLKINLSHPYMLIPYFLPEAILKAMKALSLESLGGLILISQEIKHYSLLYLFNKSRTLLKF